MKKIYTLSIALFVTFAFGQNVVITTVLDGTLSAFGCTTQGGGTSSPKIVELYVSGTVNFDNYRLQTEANGAASESDINWNNGASMTSLGTVTDSFVYLVYAQQVDTDVIFHEMYPNITSNYIRSSTMPNGNGNDAYRLVDNNNNIIDQFGNPLDISNGNDYSASWAYRDGYAKRLVGFGPNGGSFAPDSFTAEKDVFVAPNNTCQHIINTINLGTGSYSTSVKNNEIAGLSIFPNPTSGNVLHIISHDNSEKNVAIFDVLGKEVINTNTINKTINLNNLNAGVYIVKITENGKKATKKLVVK